ncbi:MAG: helix-turn-helix domain-containing protein [Candidatus Bathyarchaeia archaeon]
MNVAKQPDQRLKQLLQERNIKQVELAHALGVSPSYLNLVVNGWTVPSKTFRHRTARCLQVPESQIFGGGNNR